MSRQRRLATSRADRTSAAVTDADVSAAPSPPEATAKASFGAVFFFCLGALAMKLVAGALPPFFSSAFDLLVYAGIAISVAVAYRRFVRRSLETRRRERQRQQERAPRA